MRETVALAEFLADAAFDALPAAAIEAATTIVLDTLGCALGAVGTPEARIAWSVTRSLSGEPRASLIGTASRTSEYLAAFANGITSHTIELDDTHRESITHVATGVVPAALAVGEARGASGRDLLAAVVLGYEASARIALAIQPSHWERGFHSAGTCNAFGAAAAAGHLLGLDRDRMTSALGLAGTQAGGLLESIFFEGDMSKRLNPGRAAANGVMAALLAAEGFTGPATVLEGPFGFLRATADLPTPERITRDLGTVYEITRTSLKPYACCRYYHSAIDAYFALRAEHDVRPDDILAIESRSFERAVRTRPHRARPVSVGDAQMSLPYSLAVAILRGRVETADFDERRLGDPRIGALAERIRVVADPELSDLFPREAWGNKLSVTLRDGRTLTARVDLPKGEPEFPMSPAEVDDKFHRLADPVLGLERAARVIELARQLERLPRLRALTQALAGPG